MNDYLVSDLSGFEGERRSVGVGYVFKGDDAAFDDGDISVSVGDVAVFDDPDAGHHTGQCELIHSSESVGYVDAIYAVDYDSRDGYAVEIGVTAPLGRVGVTDRHVGVVTEDTVVGGVNDTHARNMASRLVDSDEYDRHFTETHHLGKDGVPADLWDRYDEDGRSGPGCEVCTGDGVEVTGE